MQLKLVTVAHAKKIHDRELARHPGLPGVRDEGLLESALASAQNVVCYVEGADLFDIAAAYVFHIAENQPFLDGNKRTAIAVALQFLLVNGERCAPAPGPFFDMMIEIAHKRIDKAGIARFLRQAAGAAP